MLSLARAIGIDEVQYQAVLLEDSGELTDLGHGGVPVAALADGELDRVVGKGRGGRECQCCYCAAKLVFPHRILPFDVLFL
jgi:hypothetical protein